MNQICLGLYLSNCISDNVSKGNAAKKSLSNFRLSSIIYDLYPNIAHDGK